MLKYILLISAIVFGQYDQWPGEGKFTLTSPNSLTNFPLLIRLNSSFKFEQAQSDGSDIRFSSGGMSLKYELENYDVKNKMASFWILIEDLSVGDTEINIHWGNRSVNSESMPNDVFNSSNNFQGVWHINDNKDTIYDATNNANTGKYFGSVGFDYVPGIAGGANFFHGHWDNINTGNHSSLDMTEGILTLSAWTWLDGNTTGGHDGIAGKFTWDGVSQTQYYIGKYGNSFRMHVHDGSRETDVSSSNYPDSVWHLVTGVKTPNNIILYVNGEEITRKSVNATLNSRAIAADFEIGRMDLAQAYFGIIDEIRVSDVARSPEWIKFSYDSQKPNQTVVSELTVISEGPVPVLKNKREKEFFEILYGNSKENFKLVIYNIYGKKIKVYSLPKLFNQESFEKQIEGLPKGLYTFKLKGKSNFTKRIVIF